MLLQISNLKTTTKIPIGIGTPITERPSHTTGPDHVSGDSAGQNRHRSENGVKSTVDPCSKLIRVKSRLDPSD